MELNSVRIFLGEIFTYSSIPAIIIGIYRWKVLSTEMKALFINLLLYIGIAYFSILTVKWGWENNIFLNYVSTINDAIFLTMFFYIVIKNDSLKKIVRLVGILCVIISLLDAFWLTGYQKPNSISGSFVVLSVLSINIYCLVKIIKELESSLLLSSIFWSNIAIFLAFFFPLFQLIFNTQLYEFSEDLFYQFDIFVKSMLIIANIFYALAFWYAKPQIQTV